MGWLNKIFGGGEKVQPVSIDDENFDREVVESVLPVLLDVWGPSCVHCVKLEPIIFELARSYQGRVKVAEMNAAKAGQTAARLGVRGTPTVLYFKKGRVVERVVGFRGSLYHTEIIENELLDRAGGEA